MMTTDTLDTRENFTFTVTVTVAVGGIAREHNVVVPCYVEPGGYGYSLPAEDEEHGRAFAVTRDFISNTVMEALSKQRP